MSGGVSGGAALRWRHTGTPWRHSSFEVALEAHAGADAGADGSSSERRGEPGRAPSI
jgi:hypothetical protein